MSKISNPFVCGGPVNPRKFVGRDREINRIFDQLNSYELGSVAISGERRIGKTSLLHYVSDRDVIKRWKQNEAQSIFIYQDCGLISPFTITFFWQVIIRKLYEKLKLKNADPNLVKAAHDLFKKDSIKTIDIEILLDALYAADLIIVLILDEFEWCVRTDAKNETITRDFLTGLRGLINLIPKALSLIVATRQTLDNVCKDIRFMASPFFNNFVFVYLRPFNRYEVELLLEHMLANTEVVFTQSEKNLIYRFAGTHPLLLQVAASLVFDLKGKGESQIHDFLIRAQFYDIVKHHFEEFWNLSQPMMQKILVYFARDKKAEATNLLQYYSNERDTLLQRGLIIEHNGEYSIFSPIFKEWIVKNLYWLSDNKINPFKDIPITTPTAPTIFISYSHKDEKEKEALLVQLGVLQKGAGLVDLWSDDRIGAGEDWLQEINNAIDRAKVAILLISANFLTSEFIKHKEVPKIMTQQRDNEELIIIPIIAKHCAWRKVEWLVRMNVWPPNGNPVWRNGGTNADKELSIIAEKIADIMKRK
jgi:AAA+ ATPase superfamily predicted ATPase